MNFNMQLLGLDFSLTLTKPNQNEIISRAEQQKALNTFKDKILAILSHDLRVPIGNLTTMVPILFDDGLEATDRVLVKKGICKQLQAVNELVDNLLRWAASSFRKDIQHTESLNVFDIAQQNIDLLQNNADGKQIQIINNIPYFAQVAANYDQMSIIIRNLISNAIKFTPPHGRISLSAVTKEQMTEIVIADTGIGMTDEQLNKLFTYLYISTYGTQGEKGIGLGLLLCKEYVETNGGSISVKSELHKGTTFTVRLPVSRQTRDLVY